MRKMENAQEDRVGVNECEGTRGWKDLDSRSYYDCLRVCVQVGAYLSSPSETH